MQVKMILYRDYLFKENIERLKILSKKYPDKVNIYLYDFYPFWHYVLIDNKKIYFSYHPLGKLGYKNSNVFKVSNNLKLFEAFYSNIKLIKKGSKKYEKS